MAIRGDEIPDNLEDLKQNYALIQSAFKQLDMDLEIQKEEYEIKILELNQEIAHVQAKYRNILKTDEVKKFVEKKDKEITDLYALIDQYSKSNKMMEEMNETIQKKDEEISKFQKEMNFHSDKIKMFEDESKLLDEINDELEAMLQIREKKVKDLEEALEDIEKSNRDLRERVEKFQDQAQNPENLQFETEFTGGHVMDRQYNQEMLLKQNKIREKMTYKLNMKNSYWDSIKFRMYFDSLPSSMSQNLHMDYFDRFKKLCGVNDQIDIILENLIEHYLMNKNLRSENQNLYGVSKDLVLVLLSYQNFLNYLRNQYLKKNTKEEIEILESGDLNQEIVDNYAKIDEIYNLLKNGDFSTNFAFSSLNETHLKLKEQIDLSELEENPNSYFKYILNRIFTKLIETYTAEFADPDSKQIIKSIIPKIFYVNEGIFEMSVESRKNEKIKEFYENLKENLREFKDWFDGFYKQLDSHRLESNKVKEELKTGIWNSHVNDMKRDLNNFLKIKEELKSIEEDKTGLSDTITEKTKEIEKFKKIKINLDSKIFKLQTKANNISTLELKIEELEKKQKSYVQKISDLEKENHSLAKISPLDRVKGGKMDVNMKGLAKLRNFKKKINRGSSFMNMFSKGNKKAEYNPKVKFEVNSLNAVLSNLVNELNYYKAHCTYQKLEKYKVQSPIFHKMLIKYFKDQIEVPLIKESLGFIRNSNFNIKKNISSMRVINPRDRQNFQKHVETFVHKRNMINTLYLNSKNMLQESINQEDMTEFGYDINFCQEIGDRSKNSKESIYGKLKLLDSKPQISSSEKPKLFFDLLIQ